MTTQSPASSAGRLDGSVAALLPNPRDYSDDFIRRTELQEADRAEYRQAWYAAHEETSKAYRVGRYQEVRP